MPSARTRVSTFLGELKRRKVYQVTVVYILLALGGLELLDVLIPATRLPDWATVFLLALAITGLPLAIVFAWTFDITRQGVVRTPELVEGASRGPPEVAPAGDRFSERASASEVDSADLDPAAIAVLPFENLSRSEEAEPFVVGLHDDLLTELSRAPALTVISRTSVRRYRDSKKSVREIAKELGAGTIVEGGVQRAGNRVRLNVQVIDARTEAHRWAERYDRELTAETIFDLQSELASMIMSALRTRLTGAKPTRPEDNPTDDIEAYRLVAIGRESFVDRTEQGLQDAAAYFQRAIDIDPGYALAWAGLGMALVSMVDYGHLDSEVLLERGIAACTRAVELGPDLAEAHAALGMLRTFQRDGPAARDALARAVALGPGLSLGHQWASWIDLLMGEPERALKSAARAVLLDPLDPEARGNFALAHLATGDAGRAITEATRALEPHPDFSYATWVLGLALFHAEQQGDGCARLQTLRERQFAPWGTMARGIQQAAGGDDAGVAATLEELDREGAHFKAGVLCAARGDAGAAFNAMRRATPLFWDDALFLRYFRADPMAALRTDSRMAAILADLNASWGIDPGA